MPVLWAEDAPSLFERELTLESLEAGFDAAPARGFGVYGGGGAVWISDGNRRTSFGGGLTPKPGVGYGLTDGGCVARRRPRITSVT